MDPYNIGYSMKNIPIPSKEVYSKKLLEKITVLIIRMRWKAFFYNNEENGSENCTERTFYGIKSKKFPPKIKDLENFESDLLMLMHKIKFRKSFNSFQQEIKKDIHHIKSSNKTVLLSDKTKNIYLVDNSMHAQLLHNNIINNYTKATPQVYNDINLEASKIAARLKLDKKIEILPRKNAFITIKDHKKNFMSNPKCRLINPAKSEIGIISKRILDNINTKVRKTTRLTQWSNSIDVVSWFKTIQNKNRAKFTQFDFTDFYASISNVLLQEALEFAKNYIDISEQDIDIIFHARRTLLFSDDSEWVKTTDREGAFDVSMGSYDGGGICDLVGLYILDKLREAFPGVFFGIYKDDALALTNNTNGPAQDRFRKDIIRMMNNFGLSITIDTNLTVINFLDVSLNLNNNTYKPYRKPNDRLSYINVGSCHPPVVFKNLVKNISNRISNLSSDVNIFNNVAPIYNQALKDSGFKEEIKYRPTISPDVKKKRNRNRKIIWFTPPYSPEVTFNIGRYFLSLIDRHFPTNHKYRKLFNRHNLKISFSSTSNFKNIIINNKQNRKMEGGCSCRDKSLCPLNGTCMAETIIYEANVESINKKNIVSSKKYVGLTEGNFKARFNNHTSSFRHWNKRSSTKLSSYVWSLKEKGINYKINWKTLAYCKPYFNGSGKCSLCNMEKWLIWKSSLDPGTCLNTRSELFTSCPHMKKHLLYFWTPRSIR